MNDLSSSLFLCFYKIVQVRRVCKTYPILLRSLLLLICVVMGLFSASLNYQYLLMVSTLLLMCLYWTIPSASYRKKYFSRLTHFFLIVEVWGRANALASQYNKAIFECEKQKLDLLEAYYILKYNYERLTLPYFSPCLNEITPCPPCIKKYLIDIAKSTEKALSGRFNA